MADREDIDALLISALYGELTPAEEARLAAHLEAHPADRAALDGLTATRARLRESRLFAVQVEPPGAVSAQLLQEAARRAPARPVEREEGWFARFVRSFMAHPAMAAAAMLVIVVGAATLIARKDGRPEIAETTAPAQRAPAAPIDPAVTAAAGSAAPRQEGGGGASFEQYEVHLADEAPAADGLADGKADRAQVEGRYGMGAGTALASKAKKEAPSELARKRGPAGIEVRTPAAAPKEFADAPARVARDDAEEVGATAATREERAAGGDAPKGAFAAPPPPPAAAPAQTPSAPPSPSAARSSSAGLAAGAPVSTDEAKADAEPATAWARAQLDRARAAVRANDCRTASQLAARIATQAPAFYEQHVKTDRALQGCAAYIAAEQKRLEAERARARPASPPTE